MPKSAAWPMVPRPTTARSRRQSAGADCCASSGASWRPWDSGPLPEARSFALADAAVERRKNLRCAGSRRDAVWQGGLGAGHAGPDDGRPVADGAARRSESLDGALLPRRETGVLFDEIERALHPAISLDTVGALLAEREAIKARLAEHLRRARDAARRARGAVEDARRPLARRGACEHAGRAANRPT